MATPIINSQIDAINSTLGELADDLVTLRPLAKDVKDSVAASYITDTATGAIASFPDGADGIPVKDLKVAIEPVQNLNGQSSPYPAGSGKNLLPPILSGNVSSLTYAGVTVSVVNQKFSVSGTATANGGRLNLSTIPFTLKAGSYVLSASGSTSLPPAIIQKTSDNTPVRQGLGTFTLSADTEVTMGFNLSNGATYSGTASIQIESGTSATEWSPYSNICPISGWNGAEVTRVGANLFGGDVLAQGIKTAISSATIDTTEKTVNFASVSANQKVFSDIPFKENTRYTLILYGKNSGSSSKETNILVRYTDGTSTSNSIKFATAGDYSYAVYNTTANKTVKNIGGIWSANNTILKYEQCGIFEGVLTSADFEPYNGDIYNISWEDEAGIVYGATWDAVAGKLKITHESIDLGSINWYAGGGYYKTTRLDGVIKRPANATEVNVLCSALSPLNWSTDNTQGIWIVPQSNSSDASLVWAKDGVSANADAFKTAMNGVYLVYELATPIEVDLTAVEIETLLGQNNIWANCGSVDVEYRADTKLYINKMIANALNA